MLRTVLAVLSMGAAVAIFSCSDAKLGNPGNDAGRDTGSDACSGTLTSARCYRACDGSFARPDGGACPDSYTYLAAACLPYGSHTDGSGPSTCGVDASTDGPADARDGNSHDTAPDACNGTVVAASCYRACDATYRQPDGGACPDSFAYHAAFCVPPGGFADGAGPTGNCPGDPSTDGAAGGGTSGGTPTGGAAGGAAGASGAAGHSDGSGPVAGTGGAGGSGSGGVAGAATGGSGTAGNGGGGICTNLVNDAPAAPVRFHSGERPADGLGAGGVIADGVYNLVSSDLYRSSDDSPPTTVVVTIRISNGGTRMESVAGYEGDGGVGSIASASVRMLATSGIQVTETEICRKDGDVQPDAVEDYTATPTTLMLSSPLYVKRYVHR